MGTQRVYICPKLLQRLYSPKQTNHILLNITGTENYVAVCDDNQYYITVLDLHKMTFNKKFRGFEKVLLEDGDYDGHEVEAIAIHPDETYVAYTTLFTSEVIFADFIGTRLRTIQGLLFVIILTRALNQIGNALLKSPGYYKSDQTTRCVRTTTLHSTVICIVKLSFLGVCSIVGSDVSGFIMDHV